MAKVVALYKHPASTKDFDAYYYAKHVPIAKKIPGLKRYEVSAGPVSSVQGGETPYHLAAILTFDSVAAIASALQAPEGQATAADLGNFATGGVDLLLFDTKDV